VQATDWMRAIAEQNLNQSKAAFEGFLTVARNAIRGVDQQAAAISLYSDFRKINSLCLSSLDSLSKASFASFA
jgi:hypothetical protein